MDLRVEKTERAIKNAFLSLRGRKALEKITVKELCALACINKSTFYAHYEDIYALSDALEKEVVHSVFKSITGGREYTLENSDVFTRDLYMAFVANSSLIDIVFSGKDKSRLGDCLEEEIKKLIWSKYPEYRNDIERNILLSYMIQGTFHAYKNNQDVELDTLVGVSEKIVRRLIPLYGGLPQNYPNIDTSSNGSDIFPALY